MKLHERSVRNLFSSFFPTPMCIFKRIKILKVKDIYRLYMAIYMFKIIKLNLCPTLQNNLNLTFPQWLSGIKLSLKHGGDKFDSGHCPVDIGCNFSCLTNNNKDLL